MSEKVLKIAGRRPLLLALIIMATIATGLLFSGWLTPAPGRAQNNNPNPDPNNENTNCDNPTTTTTCAGPAQLVLNNVVIYPAAATNAPFDSIVCMGDTISASLLWSTLPSTNQSITCHTCDGSRPTNWCDDPVFSTGDSPCKITNEWQNSYEDDLWWVGFRSTNGIGNSMNFCCLTSAVIGYVSFDNLSAQMPTNPAGCGVWVHWGNDGYSSRSYAMVEVGNLAPNFSFGSGCAEDISPTDNPGTMWVLSINSCQPDVTNFMVTASPNPDLLFLGLEKFLPAGWQMSGGLTVTNTDTNDVLISRTKRLVDITHYGTQTIIASSGLSHKTNTFIITAPIKLNIQGYNDTNKYDPGAILFVNNEDANTNGIPDMDETNAAIPGETLLLPLTFTKASAPLGDTVTLVGSPSGAQIRIWTSPLRGPNPPVIDTANGPYSYSFSDTNMPTLYIEGVSASAYTNDVTLTVSSRYTPCCGDQARITVCEPQLNWQKVSADTGGVEAVEDGDDVAEPTPTISIQVEGIPYLDANGSLVITVSGTVNDPLSEIVDSSSQQLQQLTFNVNGVANSTINNLPSLVTPDTPQWPWRPSPFNVEFTQTITIPNADVGDYVIDAITSQNAAGYFAENTVQASLDWSPVSQYSIGTFGSPTYTVADQVLNVVFTNQLSTTNIDAAWVYFGSGAPTTNDCLAVETGTNTMIFTGNFPTATNQTAITLTITNSAIVTTNGMSDMEVHVQYMWGTPPTNQVDYIGEFTSSDGLSYTLANYLGLESSTAVLLNSDDGSGLATLYEPQISVYADSDDDGDIENSPGTFEPTVISVGNLSDRLTNGVIKVSVNGTQFPLKQLQDGNYYVEDPLRPGWPRFFLNSPEILAIAPSIATPGVVTEDSGNYNQAQVVYTRNGSAQVVDEQTPSFQPIQLMQQVLSQGHLSGGWSLNQLTNVAVLCFGDRVNVFLDALYQNRELNGPSQNTIQVGSFWWKKLMDPGNGNASLLTGNRTIKINNSRQDVFAGAKCLWICLHANMGWMMQYFRENVGNQDSNGYTWEEWAQESSEAVTGDAARMTAAGAQVYLQFITIVCPGAGISLDINNFSDGQWSAALGYVDKLPAGVLKNLKITSNGAVWHQFDETAFPMVSRLKTGIGKSLKVAGNSDRLGNRFFSALKGGEKVAGGVTSEGMVNGIVQGIDRHHIIPPGEGRWPEAEELRQMAASVGLTDFDEGKWNCALLPGRRKGADALYRTDPWVVKQGLTGALSHNKTLGRDYFQQCRDHLRTLISQAQQDGITAANQAYWQQKLLQGIDNIAQKFVSWQHAEWVSSINYR